MLQQQLASPVFTDSQLVVVAQNKVIKHQTFSKVGLLVNIYVVACLLLCDVSFANNINNEYANKR